MTKNQQILAKVGGGSLALLLSLSLGQQASATTLVSNLTTPSETLGSAVNYGSWVRSSFTTGSGIYGYTLNSVTLRFRQDVANTNLFVSLYSDKDGALDLLKPITNFTNPSFTTSMIEDYIFTPTTPRILDANTVYWLVAGISSSGSGQYSWRRTNSTVPDGPGWSIGNNSLFSGNQGTTWNGSTGFTAHQFSVNGTVNTSPPPPTNIPEPGSVVALLGLGGLGLASRLKKLSTRA
ncbi:PEP-CTERM sorting domain-containing protein [Microcystis aeruginosa BLCCF158]|uniref:PEP-CTERM sorting domain-containing protein n=1 Tax=Microcystis aeruginosa BLCC-F158 TaxID=2755316 RepID=A0A841V9S0_MICAE|nr:choice-of-anchor R domain-containing protein [Microcystis aeruginosa]MBC1197587.1 PEP-CTERM sorting domain-containing protein [Microcystis aeruginosa BLCC-F158]